MVYRLDKQDDSLHADLLNSICQKSNNEKMTFSKHTVFYIKAPYIIISSCAEYFVTVIKKCWNLCILFFSIFENIQLPS